MTRTDKAKRLFLPIASLASAGLLAAAGCAGDERQPVAQQPIALNRVVSEQIVVSAQPGWELLSIESSTASKRVAAIFRDGDKDFAVIDGVAGKRYDRIGLNGDNPYVDTARPDYSPVQWKSVVFSPDGTRVAYPAIEGGRNFAEGGKWFAVIDGVEGKRYDSIGVLRFSPDSKHLAYSAFESGQWFVVVDGVEGKRYKGMTFPSFSPDSERVAYPALEDGKWFAVVGGVEGKRYDMVGDIVFSSDSKHIAYTALAEQDLFVVVDSTEGKRYNIDISSPEKRYAWNTYVRSPEDLPSIFSPDGQKVANRVGVWGSSFVVTDGVQGKKYVHVDEIKFSPDGRRIAYAAVVKYSSYGGSLSAAVVDGVEGKRYETLHGLNFSPDNDKVAYIAGEGGTRFVVVNGVEGRQYSYIHGSPVFSPDGRRLAYVASQDRGRFVVIDGTDGKPYERVWLLQNAFSPDGNIIRYLSKGGGVYYFVEEEIK